MGKNVLITGGTRGIGAACSEIFAKNGHNVFATYNKDEKSADEISKRLGIKVYQADIGNRESLSATLDKIVNDAKNIDILINNAGIAQQKLFVDIEDDDWDNMINVNLTGIYNVTKRVLKNMLSNNGGSVVNISSIWGQCGASCETHYSAAKAGVAGLTKALAKEMALSGIRINCVAPGMIETQMNCALSREEIEEICEEIPMGRCGTPEECAETVYFLASEKAAYITGQIVEVNGGWNI